MFPVLHYITIVNFRPLLLNDQTFWGPLLTEEISTFCYFWYSWLVLILQYHFKEFNNFMESNSNLTRLVLLLEHAFTILRFTIDNKFGYTLSDRKPILWSQFSEAYSVASLRCRANGYITWYWNTKHWHGVRCISMHQETNNLTLLIEMCSLSAWGKTTQLVCYAE